MNIPVNLDPENDTFTYQSFIHFTFRPDLSAGSDEDFITMLNVPIVVNFQKILELYLTWAIQNCH